MRNKLFDEIMGRFYETMDDVMESLHAAKDASFGRRLGAIRDLMMCAAIAKAKARRQLSGCYMEFAVEDIERTERSYRDIILDEDMQALLDISFG